MMTLPEYIASHLKEPFVWGQNDCVLFAARWANFRHQKNYLDGLPSWRSEREARRAIQGVGGLEKALDGRFTRIPANLAKDGDIALYNGCLCLFSGHQIVGPNMQGLQFVKRTLATCAWSL